MTGGGTQFERVLSLPRIVVHEPVLPFAAEEADATARLPEPDLDPKKIC